MTAASWPMSRGEPRATVLPVEIKGLLSWRDERRPSLQVPFLVWDISVNGIGLLLSDELKVGESIQLTFGQPLSLSINAEVKWCAVQEADYDFQEPSYRCGIRVTHPGLNLQGLVDHINRLRDK